jgi:large subunit ribosomal protein L7/L12
MAELDKIVDQLSKLTIMEATELTKKLEDLWGVSASAATSVIAAPQEPVTPDKDVEKSEYDLILESFGDKKITVIKEVKNITGLGLKEAKELVESSPSKAIKTGISKAEAEELKAKLEAVGAKVVLK